MACNFLEMCKKVVYQPEQLHERCPKLGRAHSFSLPCKGLDTL
jgi:hypothetical protein